MTQLTHLGLKNVVSFKDAQVDITDNNGFVVINGINRDSNIANNTNGAGKSLLFGTLPVALYEADPLSLAKKNKKDLHGKRGSQIAIEFDSVAGKKIRLEQHGSKYFFFIDGDDQKVQTQDIARSKLAEHWPLREEEFYTTCYINSQRQCDFQKAKPSQRLDFITNLFDLHIYDKLRAYFAKMRTDIKDRETEFQTLAVQVESVERDLAKTKWDKGSNRELQGLTKDLAAVQKELEHQYSRRKELETLIEQIERLSKRATKYFADCEELFAHETDLNMFIKNLESQLDYLDDIDEYEESLASYTERKDILDKKLKDLRKELQSLKVPSSAVKSIDSRIAKYEKQMEEHKEETRRLIRVIEDEDARLDEINEVIGKLNELGYDSIAAVDLNTEVDEEIAMAKALIALADDLDGHKNCPTCKQKVNIKLIKKQADRADKQLDELTELRKAQKLARKYYDDLEDDSVDIEKLRKQLETLQSETKKTKTRLDALLDYQDISREIKRAEESLDGLTVPRKPKGKIHYKSIPDDELEGYVDQCRQVIKLEQQLIASIEESELVSRDREALIKLFEKGDEVKFVARLKRITSKTRMMVKTNKGTLSTLQETSTTLNERVVKLESAKSNWKLLQDQKMELDSKMQEAQPIIAKKKIVDTLFAAYGNTNLKLQGATKILKLVEANLNQYSHLVFPETMQFTLEAGTRGIDAIAIRKDGTPSDISKLSGAETNCFRLLFAISILPLIPAHRRTNFMILDEPDSACSDAVREHLAKEFIPKLRALVPHIFWITPKDSDVFKEAETWVVEKQQGVSSITVSN